MASRGETAGAYESPTAHGLIVDPAEPGALRDTGSYCWAVWSAWRGSVPLLEQTVRAAVLAVTRADGVAPRCYVEVAEGRGVELFRSPADMREWLTPRAAAKFDGIRVAVRGTRSDLDLRIVRRSTPIISLEHEPGVVLEVRSDEEDPTTRIRSEVASAVNRGGFRRSNQPIFGSTPQGHRYNAALHAGIETRDGQLATVYALIMVGVLAIYFLSDRYTDIGPLDGSGWIPIVVVIAYGVAYQLVRFLPQSWRDRFRRAANEAIFPAVEMAERTPGRRILRNGARIGAIAAGPLVTAIVKQIV